VQLTLPRHRGFLLCLALTAGVITPAPAHSAPPCSEGYVIKPGREGDVLALIAPLGPGSVVGKGWKVGDIRIQQSRVEYALIRGEEEQVLVLHPPTARLSSEKVAQSPSFSIGWRSGASPGVAPGVPPAILEVAQRVQANDSGKFWRTCAVQGQVRAGPGWLLQANRALLLLMVLLAAFSARDLWRVVRPLGRGYWLAMLALFTVALLLRALLPPHAPLHTNTHGIREMRELISGHDALIPYLEVGQYGLAKQALLAPLAALLGGTARALFWLNITLGSLTSVALGTASALLTRSRLAGLLAALIFACLPAHVRLSASESGLVAYNLLLAVGLALAHAAVRQGRVRLYLLWAALAGFTAQLHLVALAAPVIILAAALFSPAPERRGRRRWLGVAAATALALVVSLPHAMRMFGRYWEAGQGKGTLVSLEVWSSASNLLLNPRVTPILLTVGCLAGLLLWGRRHPAAALACGVMLAGLSWAAMLVCACLSDAIRYQTTHLMLMVPLAAHALRCLAGPLRAGSHLRPVLAGVACLAMLGSALPGLRLISRPDNEDLEYAFIRQAVSTLPDRATLVLLDQRLADRRVLTDFPDFLLQEQGKQWRVIRQGDVERRGPGSRGPLILYHGLTCYSFTDQEVRRGAPGPGKIRPECHRFRQRHGLRALAEERFPTRRPRWSPRHRAFHQLPADTITLGFYMVERRKQERGR